MTWPSKRLVLAQKAVRQKFQVEPWYRMTGIGRLNGEDRVYLYVDKACREDETFQPNIEGFGFPVVLRYY